MGYPKKGKDTRAFARCKRLPRWVPRIGSLVLAFTFPLAGWGAPAVPTPDVVPSFQHIGVTNGLAQSTVTALAQGPLGYMWFATEGGVQRYDGYSYVSYRHDPTDPHSLSGGTINALAFSDDATLWVGSSNGLDRLPAGSHMFMHYRHQAGQAASLSDNNVLALLVDRSGRLWVGTGAGLDRRLPGGGFHHYTIPGDVDDAHQVTALFQDRAGRVWVGTVKGLFYYDADTDSVQPFAISQESAGQSILRSGWIDAIYQSVDGRLWVGTRAGLVVIAENGKRTRFFTHNDGEAGSLPVKWVTGIVEDTMGRIWVATYGGGLSRYDGPARGFAVFGHDVLDPTSLSSDYLLNIMRDRSGLVWLGTDGAGVNVYNPRTRAFGRYRHQPGNPQSLANNFVWAVYEDPQRNLWVASDGGLTRLDATRTKYRQYRIPPEVGFNGSSPSVKVLYADREHRLWLGTGHGIYRYLPATDAFRYYALERPGENWLGDSVNVIFDDSARRLWIGTNNGLVQFDPESGRVLRRYVSNDARAGSLPTPAVWSLCQAGDNSLWVGTTRGLFRFDPAQGRFTPPRDSSGKPDVLAASDILDCRTASDGSLWVGTTSGLVHFVPGIGTLHRFTVADGLSSAMIYSVLPGPKGDIWVGTSRGLARIDTATNTVRNYDVETGLYNKEFNEGAAYAGADDTLYFGSINGLAVVHVNELGVIPPPAPVVITGVDVMGQAVPLTRDIGGRRSLRLDYDQSSLSVQVAVLDFALPARNRFKYRLDGFDTAWHELAEGHTITYTNLDPGRYTLRVLGSGGDGVWSREEAHFAIRIMPPPWLSWWAYLIYIVFAVCAVTATFYLFARRVRQKRDFSHEQRRRSLAESQQALIEAVSPLRSESDIARVFIERLPPLLAHDRALFFMDEAGGLRLDSVSGTGSDERERLALWPLERPECLARLRQTRRVIVLTRADVGSLERRLEFERRCHYLALPLVMTNGLMHVLVIGRMHRVFNPAEQATASILCNQLSVMFEKAHLIHQLEDMATTDGLTGAYTRRAFLERAEAEFSRCARYGHALAVFMIDIDHFKNVNDTCGHVIGDKVLYATMQTCQRILRAPDLVGRYGGEEFIACLPETNVEQAREVAERVRAAVESQQLGSAEQTFRVTISIGVVVGDERPRTLMDLIETADEALYAAKHRGRNCVVIGD